MDRKMVREDPGKRSELVCSGKASERGVPGRDHRLVEAVLWIARMGSPWRDRPKHFGAWHTAYRRCSRWSQQGVGARMAEALTSDADLEELFVDSTIVRAHQHATGAPKKRASTPSDGAEGAEHPNSCGGRSCGESLARASARRASGRYYRRDGPHQGD